MLMIYLVSYMIDVLLIAILKQLASIFIILLILTKVLSITTHLIWKRLFGKHISILKYTTYIGTPIHELGHMIMCVLFRHKIISYKLAQFDMSTGELGYVEHDFNQKNLYHQIGNFFIAIGPILLGGLVVLALNYWILPSSTTSFINQITSTQKLYYNIFEPNIFKETLSLYNTWFSNIVSEINFGHIKTYIALILILSIVLHIDLSKADVNAAKKGIIYIVLSLVVINVVLYYFSYASFIRVDYFIMKYTMLFNLFLPLLLVFGTLCLVITYIFTLIYNLFSQN